MHKSINSQRSQKAIRKRRSEKTVPGGLRAGNKETDIDTNQTILPSLHVRRKQVGGNYARTVCIAAAFLPMLHTRSKGL